ncbi:MAG TPA: PD-(D/E)XK nuclease family protein, partial [bacterium]|nr:PD-(D/E)XK nuclease family protein [bacterium]
LYLVHRPSRQADLFAPRPDRNRWIDWIGAALDATGAGLIREAPAPPPRIPEYPALESIREWIRRPSGPEPAGAEPIPAGDDPVFCAAVTTIRDYLFDRDEYVKKHILHMTDHFRSPESDPGRETARRLGDAYHRLMEMHPDLAEEAMETACAVLESGLSQVPGPERREAVNRLRSMADRTRTWELFDALKRGAGHHELPFNITLKAGIVHGIIDLLISIDGIWHVVDYKTDRSPAQKDRIDAWLAEHRREHAFQMSVYALAIRGAAPAQLEIPVIIYFADAGEAVRYTFTPADLDALAAHLETTLAAMKRCGPVADATDEDTAEPED